MNDLDKLPGFLILGAPKAGTSALFEFLCQHPQIFMPDNKEPAFFLYDERGIEGQKSSSITQWDDYLALFSEKKAGQIGGEATTSYLGQVWAAERIKVRLPDAKLIAVLRDPVQRAYSHYLQHLRAGVEPAATFGEAVERELGEGARGKGEEVRVERDAGRLVGVPAYVDLGFYHRQLMEYYKRFKPEQIRVYLQSDLRRDAAGMLKDICGFLNVDEGFVFNTGAQVNVTGIPRSESIDRLLSTRNSLAFVAKQFVPKRLRSILRRRLRRANLHKPEIDSGVAERLREIYADDTRQLEELLGRELWGV